MVNLVCERAKPHAKFYSRSLKNKAITFSSNGKWQPKLHISYLPLEKVQHR